MLKVVYLHNQITHPAHEAYARAVNARFFPYYYYNKYPRYISYLFLALRFVFSRYDVILTDEPDFVAGVIKQLSFKRMKLVATQDSNTPYYYSQNKITNYSKKIFKWAAMQYDLIICMSPQQFAAIKSIIKNHKKLRLSFNGISNDRYLEYSKFSYNGLSQTIFSICHLFDESIFYNKGVDIMLSVVEELEKDFSFSYSYVGRASDSDKKSFLDKRGLAKHIKKFVGEDANPSRWFSSAVCVLHLSRIEAFGIAVSEAFAAGVPVFITDQVGAKIMYENIDNKDDYIIQAGNKEEAIKKIRKFLALSSSEKRAESKKFSHAAHFFTEERACENYRKLFKEINKK